MATENKDFKVKNGLVVTNGGTFNDVVVVATPTQDSHAATKAYVDSQVFGNADGGTATTNFGGTLSGLNGGNASSF